MSGAPDILLEITERRRLRFGGGQPPPAPRGETDLQAATQNAFTAALESRRGSAVIAEVKMGSPKLGSLEGAFDPLEQARIYARNGAVALSVVVEQDYFFGSYELLARCRQASGLPTIAKDFLVSTEQLDLAANAGADAVLLIAALLDKEALLGYAEEARRRGLVPLVEMHDRADLDKLSGAEWEIVGVNNRDLRTFSVDLERSIELLPELPRSALKVAESGIAGRGDLARLASGGFDAFLIGETLVKSGSPAATLRELLGEEAGTGD